MKILVIGGTRGLGQAVVRAACEAQHTLTVLARHTGDFAAYVLPDVAVARRIRRADVAAFIVGNLDARRYLRKSVLLTT